MQMNPPYSLFPTSRTGEGVLAAQERLPALPLLPPIQSPEDACKLANDLCANQALLVISFLITLSLLSSIPPCLTLSPLPRLYIFHQTYARSSCARHTHTHTHTHMHLILHEKIYRSDFFVFLCSCQRRSQRRAWESRMCRAPNQ